MKKIINSPETFVIEMCKGIAKAHPELEFVEKYKLIKKKNINPDKVSLISGGGSGHEPAHAGYVGTGMLDCAVCGDIFASPSQIQVYNAIKECATDKGVLLVIKNYSGDCMNFNNAATLAREEDGIKVDAVYVTDDIAVKDSLYTVGRRGVAGTVFVHKIAGAMAEKGASLEEVVRVANKVIENVKTFGFALTSCTPPAKGTPIFDISDTDMEFGVGIHGEPGRKTEKIQSADELAKRIVVDLLDELKGNKSKDVAVIINGFGATPLMELYLLNNSVSNELEKAKLNIHKTLVGNYMTSIDMAGASITILKLDDELKELLDAPVSTPALSWGSILNSTAADVAGAHATAKKALKDEKKKPAEPVSYEVKGKPVVAETINTAAFVEIIDKMADIIIENEVPFCDADKMGDGDFGMSIAKGFKELKKEWKTRNKINIGAFLRSCSEIIMEYCGGASGPIWGSAFRYAGKQAGDKTEISLKDLADIMQAANTGVYETGKASFGKGAVVGDKTLVDALKPCADALTAQANSNAKLADALIFGAKEAVKGADNTKTFAAKAGRAGTVGEKSIGYPDAGAYGLGVIFTELAKYIPTIK